MQFLHVTNCKPDRTKRKWPKVKTQKVADKQTVKLYVKLNGFMCGIFIISEMRVDDKLLLQ